MSAKVEESAGELRERLEHEADGARERLISGLDRLSERGQRVERWWNGFVAGAQRHRGALIGVGVAGVGVFGLLVLRRRARLRREQQREVLFRLAQRALPVLVARLSHHADKA